MERVIIKASRSRLTSLFFVRYRVRYLDAFGISLFVLMALGPRVAIAQVARKRREKGAGEVVVAIPRTHSRSCIARLNRTVVLHEHGRA